MQRHLEVALLQIGEERGELVDAQVDADADLAQHDGDDVGDGHAQLVRRRLVDDGEARLGPVAVGIGIAGLVEELLGLAAGSKP